MLRATDINVVRSGRRLVDNVALQIDSGEPVGLIGPNGAGKSTLLDVLAGLIKADSGAVTLNGQDVRIPPCGSRR
ncbi:MAG: ATP-binding cassette domain-containing protein [Pseudomonadota bacterium]